MKNKKSSPSPSEPRRILVAEDDASMRQLLERLLSEDGHGVVAVPDGFGAMAQLQHPFDLVITDLRMPGATGLDVLQLVRRRWPATPVIVVTAYGSISGAVDAMRLGAFDYLTKPLPDPPALRKLVRQALVAGVAAPSVQLIAEDPAVKPAVEAARLVAQHDTTVLLLGESGSGKEVFARLIHESSPRSSGPFAAVNCAALAEGLLDSELFGHEKGAFTGAVARHEGKFVQASGGTLFLDEIGDTSPALQAKLLRVLQARRFERVGGEQSITADVRLITATNRNLEGEIARGSFREDLYYRLAVFPIQIPPLRQHPGDIVPLAHHFLRLLTRGPSRTAPPITAEAQNALQAYNWPGNVRELQNVIERSLILGGGDPITPALLSLPAAGDAAPAREGTLKEVERRAIEAALVAEHGHRRRAAKRLGIALRTLQYKIKEYGLA